MANRKAPSLALSEYVSPHAENSTELWRARLEMIEAVKRIYPKFLETLLAEVFPLYCQLAKAGKLAKEGNNFEKALWGDSPYEALTEDGGLKSALSKWAADFNAEAEWLIVGALRTLQGWHVSPDWRESLKWDATLGRSETAAIGEAFEFRYQGWEVRLLTWSAYSKSLRQRFEEKLLEYEKMTRQLSESRGLVPARRKYSPDNLEWFVLYQFAGMSSGDIVGCLAQKNIHREESAVLKGVKAAAQLLSWEHLRKKKKKRNRKIR